MQETPVSTLPADDEACRLAALSSTLAPIFRGRFCDLLLPGRATQIFEPDEVLYETGDRERSFYFVRGGVVKTGAITREGREIVYDLRKERDVIGELCALYDVRRDRAIALVRTAVIAVPFEEVIDTLSRHAAVLKDFIGIFCSALSQAYEHIDSLAFDSVVLRTINVLQSLVKKFGRPEGGFIELPIYLTQEELAQMVVARRERVSTALNNLRREGIVHYSPRGHLRVDLHKLDRYRLLDASTAAV